LTRDIPLPCAKTPLISMCWRAHLVPCQWQTPLLSLFPRFYATLFCSVQELAVECGQGCPLADSEFEIGSVIGGQPVQTGNLAQSANILHILGLVRPESELSVKRDCVLDIRTRENASTFGNAQHVGKFVPPQSAIPGEPLSHSPNPSILRESPLPPADSHLHGPFMIDF